MQCYQKDKRLFFAIFLFFAVSFILSPLLAQTPTIKEILNLPEEKIDIAQAALVIAKGVYPEVDIDKYLKQIDNMADSLREKISKPTIFYKRGNPRRAIQVINNYLFGEKGFTGVDDESAFLLNKVIEKKKGSCLGLSILYLSLAQRLNLSIYLVTAPKHYFVRYDNGKYRQNIETRMRGLDLPDFHYQISFNVPEGTIPKGVYLRNLSKKETIICMLGSAGAALGAKHKDKEGSNLLDLALKFAPDNPEIYFNKAIICCKNKQYSEAITLFNTVILLDPWFTEAYRNRGVAYESKGEIHKAIKDYNQAIKLDSNDASSYALRGHAYRKIGELEKAKKDFDKFVKLKKAMRENEQQ